MSLKYLIRIAVGGAFACIGTGLYIGNNIENRLKQASYYKQAVKIIQANTALIDMMGQPIKDLSINLGDKTNRVDNLTANLHVGIRGPKTSGEAYITAGKSKVEDEWILNRIEVILKNEPNRKLVVYKTE